MAIANLEVWSLPESAMTDVYNEIDITGIPEDLAAGKPTRFLDTFTREEFDSDPAHDSSCAVDDDMNTYAMIRGTWTSMLEVDLGEVKDISEVIVTFDDIMFPKNFDILVSETQLSPTNSSEIYAAGSADNTSGGTFTFNFEKKTGRYVYIRDTLSQESAGKLMGIKNLVIHENPAEYELRSFVWRDVDSIYPLSGVDVLR